MNNLKFVQSKCVVRNLSKKAVRVLGLATLPPSGDPIDLFSVIHGLSEITIIDAMRDPDGEICSKVRQGMIELVSCDLVMFNNTSIPYSVNQTVVEKDIVVESPLVIKDGVIKIAKANQYNDGVLTKEDYFSLKNSNSKLSIWQYQDFDFDGSTASIYSFNSFDFSENLIVNGSAVATTLGNELVSNKGLFGFGKKPPLLVKQHLGDKILLDREFKGLLRIWFLVSVPPSLITEERALPVVPDCVRSMRADVLDSYLVDTKSGKVLGSKSFLAPVVMSSASVKEGMEVDSGLTTDSLTIKNGAFSGGVLTSRPLGDAVWSSLPVVSDSMPVGDAANLWFNTSFSSLFVKVNNSWVCTESEVVRFGGGNGLSNCYLSSGDGLLSIIKPYDFIITEAHLSAARGGLFAFEFHNDSGKLSDGTIECSEGLGVTKLNLGIRVPAGVPLRIFLNGSNISDPRVKFKIKAII